jgi:hypothetical protein
VRKATRRSSGSPIRVVEAGRDSGSQPGHCVGVEDRKRSGRGQVSGQVVASSLIEAASRLTSPQSGGISQEFRSGSQRGCL